MPRNITRKAIHPILTSTDHRRQQESENATMLLDNAA